MLVCVAGAAVWAQDKPATEAPPPKEWETPVAQVPMAIQGGVRAVNLQERTFTVMQPPKHRQPAQVTTVAVNRETTFIMNEAVLAGMLKLGETVRVEAQRPKPYGVAIWAEGKVAGLDPLVVEASKEVKVTVLPGAEVVLVRIKEMKYEDLRPGMDTQVIAYRGTTPALAKSVETFTIAPGAASFLDQQKPAETPPAAPEKPTP
jgi:hypothetical protein